MPTINMPAFGLPEGVKQAGQRVDFKPTQFDLAIETKGYLLLWQRAATCPCSPVAAQTEQPDPNCTVCGGSGWLYFGPDASQNLSDYTLTDIQSEMVVSTGGAVIRGIMTMMDNRQDHVDVLGNWVNGTANLTVRHQNRIGYYDRITMLDAQIPYSENINCDGTPVLTTRYPAIGVNMIRSVENIYKVDVHFEVVKGVVNWINGSEPDADTRVSVHYLCHPVYLVIQHPHSTRVTLSKFKKSAPKTPTGDAEQLPIQALIKYEFWPE